MDRVGVSHTFALTRSSTESSVSKSKRGFLCRQHDGDKFADASVSSGTDRGKKAAVLAASQGSSLPISATAFGVVSLGNGRGSRQPVEISK